MSKKLVTSYTFTAASKTIQSADFTSLEKIQLITNVTSNIIIYNFADPSRGATLAGTTITLAYDTTSMADADKLQILVEDGAATIPVSLASVPSHAVTNAGTFAVQNTAALPAGTNNIGDVDVLTLPVAFNTGTRSATTQRVTIATDDLVPTNISQMNGVAVTMGNGASGTGVQRVTLASDSTGQVALAAGSQIVGSVYSATRTTNGATTFTLISAATTNATNVKASAGTLYSLNVYNNGASAAYFKLYNKATAPTVGTDTPVMTVLLPAGGGSNVPLPPMGIAFGTGISYAITTGGAVSDTGAVAITQVFVNGSYA